MKTATSTSIVRAARFAADNASTLSRSLDLSEAARRVESKHPRDYTRDELAALLDVEPRGVNWFDALADRLGL